VLTLSATHLVNDIFGNIYAPLLPLLIRGSGCRSRQPARLRWRSTCPGRCRSCSSVRSPTGGAACAGDRRPLLAVALLSLAPLANRP